jgi:uncharacterized protein DUF4170
LLLNAQPAALQFPSAAFALTAPLRRRAETNVLDTIGNRASMPDTDAKATPKQLLHLVFGGELENLATSEFKDFDKLDIVGIYPNYASAYAAWKAKAQGTVDNAHMRYFIVHLHRLLDPQSQTPSR